MPKAVAIFFIEPRDPIGSDIYRILQPFAFLNQKPGWRTSYVFWPQLMREAHQRGAWVMERFVTEYDLYVFPRSYASGDLVLNAYQFLFDQLHLLGKRLVYEVDDDFTNEHKQVIDGNALDVAAQCDALTVTTPYLADLMEARTGKPAYALPNCVSGEVWNQPFVRPTDSDKLYLGLTGSPTHEQDWMVLKDVLPQLVEAYPQVRILLGGYHHQHLKDLPNVECVPHLAYPDYAYLIKSCDVIAAPLLTNGFNLAKSPIKVIEGMAARRDLPSGTRLGAACLASDMPVYQAAIEHGFNGLLVEHTPDGWYAALERVIADAPLRHMLQRNGYRWVWRSHNIANRWMDWEHAYQTILKTPLPQVVT